MLDVNRVKNETLKKLDRFEIGDLGLNNYGIYTYKGVLKSRVKGLKTTYKTETEQYFEGEHIRWEAIKIVSSGLENEYAIRCYNKDKQSYEEFYMVLIGCDFFK